MCLQHLRARRAPEYNMPRTSLTLNLRYELDFDILTERKKKVDKWQIVIFFEERRASLSFTKHTCARTHTHTCIFITTDPDKTRAVLPINVESTSFAFWAWESKVYSVLFAEDRFNFGPLLLHATQVHLIATLPGKIYNIISIHANVECPLNIRVIYTCKRIGFLSQMQLRVTFVCIRRHRGAHGGQIK